MKKYMLLAALLAVTPAVSFAQDAPGDQETPAVATPDSTNPDAPVAGKNSFTEDQTRERMTEAGYTDVDGLKLDDQGFWNATAKKDGKQVNLVMDYQGNIVAK